VFLSDAAASSGPVAPLTEWTGAGTSFGSAIVVQRHFFDPTGFDLWVGAPGWDQQRGAIHRFVDAHIDPGRPADAADLTVTSSMRSDRLGSALIPCADLDGDGIADLAAPLPAFAEPDDWELSTAEPILDLAGAVVFLLSTELPDSGTVPAWSAGRIYWGSQRGEGAGSAVSCDHDLDGDGRIDVFVGAPWFEGTAGRVAHLVASPLPASGPLAVRAVRTFQGNTDQEWFGASLAALSLDRRPALAVGAPGSDAGHGRVYVFPGTEIISQESLRTTAVFVQDPPPDYVNHFGRSLAVGSMFGTADDLIIGAPDFRDGPNGYDSGALWIFDGADSSAWGQETAASTAQAIVTGSTPFSRVGRHIALGEPDDDGLSALLVPTRAAAEPTTTP